MTDTPEPTPVVPLSDWADLDMYDTAFPPDVEVIEHNPYNSTQDDTQTFEPLPTSDPQAAASSIPLAALDTMGAAPALAGAPAIGGARRTVAEAVTAARRQVEHPSQNWLGWCLKFCRLCWGLPLLGIPNANAGWAGAVRRRTTVRHGYPPPGALVFWAVGKFGHIALSAGGGLVYSNDILRAGKIDLVSIGKITSGWKAIYRGWTSDYCGAATLPLRLVHYGHVRDAARRDPKAPQGATTAGAKDSVIIVEKALVSRRLLETRWVDGSFGTKTVDAYAAYQKSLGYKGPDADGIPGISSLISLGNAHGFGVI